MTTTLRRKFIQTGALVFRTIFVPIFFLVCNAKTNRTFRIFYIMKSIINHLSFYFKMLVYCASGDLYTHMVY